MNVGHALALFTIPINARHRLAVHIEHLVSKPDFCESNLDVDCEYNLNGLVFKTYKNKLVYPDIIIHRRNGVNFLVIEGKSKGKNWRKDFDKLRHFVNHKDFLYPFGIFLFFHEDRVKIKVWQQGVKQNLPDYFPQSVPDAQPSS
jgi:hypothetical protein